MMKASVLVVDRDAPLISNEAGERTGHPETSSRVYRRACYNVPKNNAGIGSAAIRVGAFAMTRDNDITGLLRDASNGDARAGESLYQNIYEELMKISRAQRRRWSGNDTLSTTALVNEAYLKLAGTDLSGFRDRTHFFATASRVMRQVLVDYAKRASAAKRGGDAVRVTLSSVAPTPDMLFEDMVLIDALLSELEQDDARCARVFECRVFGGMTIEETASALSTSPATVKRDWRYVTAWVYQRMRDDESNV